MKMTGFVSIHAFLLKQKGLPVEKKKTLLLAAQ